MEEDFLREVPSELIINTFFCGNSIFKDIAANARSNKTDASAAHITPASILRKNNGFIFSPDLSRIIR